MAINKYYNLSHGLYLTQLQDNNCVIYFDRFPPTIYYRHLLYTTWETALQKAGWLINTYEGHCQ